MVGVPSALYLAAGLLAVAAASGLAFALYSGALYSGAADRGGLRADPTRAIGVAGALVYAVSHVLAGAQVSSPQVWIWLHVAGLVGIAIGAAPERIVLVSGAALLVPALPEVGSYVAAAAGLIAAVRFARPGRAALFAAAGLALMAAGHGIGPTRPDLASWSFVAGSLSIGAWLWNFSSRRILLKLLTAFVAALLAMAILIAAVLSTVSSAQLTGDELNRLGRLADQLSQDIQAWPGQAVTAALPLSRSVGPLIDTVLGPADAEGVFDLSLSTQDFFVTLDPAGQLINAYPADLAGSLRLGLAGDPLIANLRQGTAQDQAGGLLSVGNTIVAFGAVALRRDGARPEDPPAGVLITGRLADGVWGAQQAVTLDVGLIGTVGGQVVFSTERVGVAGQDVIEGLGDRAQSDLDVDQQLLFAASADISDLERGAVLGRIVATSTPQVLASLERNQTQRLFLASLIGGILAVVVAAVVTRRFVRPIARLTQVADLVGAGDLGSRAGITSPDEVGVLGATFDEMVESLSEQQRDLTVSAQREARLRGRLESMTTSMSDGLIAVDGAGRIITFNPAAQAMTGHDADDATGRPLADVLVGDVLNRGAVDDLINEEGPGAEPPPGDPLQLRNAMDPSSVASRVLLARGDGTKLPVSATAAPVRAPNGEILGRVYVLRDITRDLEVEQMKTQFLANVSHELRTPITPIKGYAKVLAGRELPAEKTRQFAEQILNSTTRLERIVAKIVDFAGLDSGRVALRLDEVDLASLVCDTLTHWRDEHQDREFRNQLNGALPPVRADHGYLRRCLDELVDNAVKFSPDGSPVVVTGVARNDTVRVQVIDRGVGIEEEALNRLFSDFVQIDGTETRSYGGLGLGLGLVKRILDGIGASVEVSSTPGTGTSVTMVLNAAGPIPVRPLPQPPAPRGSVPPPPAAASRST
ncbi:MAG: ATP-binding protein [Euzebya sp.]